LKLVGKREHLHIVRLLATFQHHDIYHLMFPWAEGDLARFWSHNPVPNPTLDNFQWMVEQLHGITDALSVIHKLEPREQSESIYYGRHGDLKPENILYFRNPDDTITLKLCDFGHACFHSSRDEASLQASKAAYTLTYRPPECDISSAMISQSSDIWNLGCIYLEFIVWVFLGNEGLQKFKDDRSEKSEDGIDSNSFFQSRPSSRTGNHTSSVSLAVKDVR
jgi:serine/threonine protein kinase